MFSMKITRKGRMTPSQVGFAAAQTCPCRKHKSPLSPRHRVCCGVPVYISPSWADANIGSRREEASVWVRVIRFCPLLLLFVFFLYAWVNLSSWNRACGVVARLSPHVGLGSGLPMLPCIVCCPWTMCVERHVGGVWSHRTTITWTQHLKHMGMQWVPVAPVHSAYKVLPYSLGLLGL